MIDSISKDKKTLLLLAKYNGLTCTQLGEELWVTPHGNRQSWARPAGKILARLRGMGYTMRKLGESKKHIITEKGRELLK